MIRFCYGNVQNASWYTKQEWTVFHCCLVYNSSCWYSGYITWVTAGISYLYVISHPGQLSLLPLWFSLCNILVSAIVWYGGVSRNTKYLNNSDGTILPWGRGEGKRWMWYCTKYRDTIRCQSALLYFTVYTSRPTVSSILTDAFARILMLSKVVDSIQTHRRPSTTFECGGWDGIKNLAQRDFGSVQTDAVDRNRRQSHSRTVERRSNVAPMFTLIDLSSVRTSMQMFNTSVLAVWASVLSLTPSTTVDCGWWCQRMLYWNIAVLDFFRFSNARFLRLSLRSNVSVRSPLKTSL